MDLLANIIASKRARLKRATQSVPIDRMRARAEQARHGAVAHRFAKALQDQTKTNIIAEFKRRSPSKGDINRQADPARMAHVYEKAGAAALSVLTEEDFFAGSLDDLRTVRDVTALPILRKDFIVADYQVYESAAAGADALLLIVSALADDKLHDLRTLAEDNLGIDAMVEVHTKEELDRALNIGARLIGVNNRDLRTFEVSTETSIKLARAVPPDVTLISESGLSPAEVRRLKALGYKGFLVGEVLMRAEDPTTVLNDFISVTGDTNEHVHVKICGITNLEDARAAVNAGADMLGFNFYPASSRFIEPERARSIIDAIRADAVPQDEVTMVGVFVNKTSPEEVIRIAETAGLDAVQLHGDESIEFSQTVKNLCPRLMLIKVLRVADGFEPSRAAAYEVDAVMLDSFHSELWGGTGKAFDWQIARKTSELVPRLFLAGGLTPENVATAIAAVQPYAIDACSSVEASPGKKDAQRMKEFVRRARGE